MFRSRHSPGSRFQQGGLFSTPIPTRLVSNDEFIPPPQTPAQAHVESLAQAYAAHGASRLGLSRREFLKTTGGTAAALLAMNTVFGRFFDVLDVELVEAAAFTERQGRPFFIFDVQTHYVSTGYDPNDDESRRRGAVTRQGLLGLRRRAKDMDVNPMLERDRGTLSDLAWMNFVKEVFLDSETSLALISTPPGPYPQEAVCRRKKWRISGMKSIASPILNACSRMGS